MATNQEPPRLSKEFIFLVGLIALITAFLFSWCGPKLRSTLFSETTLIPSAHAAPHPTRRQPAKRPTRRRPPGMRWQPLIPLTLDPPKARTAPSSYHPLLWKLIRSRQGSGDAPEL